MMTKWGHGGGVQFSAAQFLSKKKSLLCTYAYVLYCTYRHDYYSICIAVSDRHDFLGPSFLWLSPSTVLGTYRL